MEVKKMSRKISHMVFTLRRKVNGRVTADLNTWAIPWQSARVETKQENQAFSYENEIFCSSAARSLHLTSHGNNVRQTPPLKYIFLMEKRQTFDGIGIEYGGNQNF